MCWLAFRQDDFDVLLGKTDEQFKFATESGDVAAQRHQMHVGLVFELRYLRLGNPESDGQCGL